MKLRPLDSKLLSLLVKDFWPDFGYVDYEPKTETYFIGERDFLFAVLQNNGKYPVLMLRASCQPMVAATLGYVISASCDFKFGRLFEIDAQGKWVYDENAQGIAADNIYRLWFDVDTPVTKDGNIGFELKTVKELEEMN